MASTRRHAWGQGHGMLSGKRRLGWRSSGEHSDLPGGAQRASGTRVASVRKPRWGRQCTGRRRRKPLPTEVHYVHPWIWAPAPPRTDAPPRTELPRLRPQTLLGPQRDSYQARSGTAAGKPAVCTGTVREGRELASGPFSGNLCALKKPLPHNTVHGGSLHCDLTLQKGKYFLRFPNQTCPIKNGILDSDMN